jgi:hypothetical protein
MTITKASGIGRSRKQRDRIQPRNSTAPIRPVEHLETRELLSTLQPVSEKFQWTFRGNVVQHEIQFDASGNCLSVRNPQVFGSNDCSLGQFGTPPNRLLVTFNSNVNKKSVNVLSDVSITGDVDPVDPLRAYSGLVSKRTLSIGLSGDFVEGSGTDITLSLQGIQGKKKFGFMLPWSDSFAVGSATDPGNPGDPGDGVPPRVSSMTPAPGGTSTQPLNYIEALFSEDLNPSTVNSSSFQVIGSGGDGIFGNGNEQVVTPQSVVYNSATDSVRFTPFSTLPNDMYQVRLSGFIRDVAGNALDGDGNGQAGGDYVSTFRMNVATQPPWTPPPIGPGDITPPAVTGVTPGLNGVVSASPTSIVTTFSEAVDPNTVNANTIRVVASGQDGYFGNSNDRPVTVQSVAYNPFTRQAILQLGEHLLEDAYRVQVTGDGGIRDLAGNSLDGDRDGRGGGSFNSEFRVDTTAPEVTLALGEGSDSGVPKDNRTNLPSNVVFSGSVSDGTVGKPANFSVELDIDGDGFDDGTATTDALGNFAVAAPPSFVASGERVGRVRVTDLAGNSRIMNTTYSVDQAPPAVGFAQPLLSLSQAPATLEVLFNEPMNPHGVQDLKNYSLMAAGGDGIFFNGTNDASQYLTGATYLPAENKVVLTVSPSLPDDAYRLVVKSNGTLQDLAGNPVQEQSFQDVQVDQFSRDKVQRSPNAQPINPSLIRQFPDVESTYYEQDDPTKSYMSQTIARSQLGPLVNPNAVVLLPETEPVLGPASNNTTGSCESATGSFAFGTDSGEDPNIVITGTDFGAADSDFYCFRARAGEIVFFNITDDFGFILPTFPTIRIWDLGTDGAPGGTGDAADRPLVDEALLQIFQANASNFGALIPDFVEVQITGITGSALDNPEREADITTANGVVVPGNPLGTEDRAPQDRLYALQIDTDRFLGPAVQNYVVTGQFRKPFTTATNLQQIVYVDFDGAQGIHGFERFDPFGVATPITVDMPAFDVRDYGYDPIFQDTFIDEMLAQMRDDLERVNFQAINVGQNSASGISRFSYELRDSRHFPDPGNAANVTHVYVGGGASVAQLPLGVLGIAEEVDTGNQHGNNSALVFSKDVAGFDQLGVAPLGLGPARIPELAAELAQTASHELGHVLGLWHTRMEGFEFCDFDLDPTCAPSWDNIIDPIVAPVGSDVHHRFDRFRDFGFTVGGVTTSIGVEFFDGVEDSIGTLGWDMAGRDLISPRVLDMDVTPGQIKLVFSEGVDISTLITGVGGASTISLERAGFDNDFSTAVAIPLLPVGTRATPLPQADPCGGVIPAGISLYDSCISTLTLQVADPTQVVQNDLYRLTLSSVSTRAIRDMSGNPLDGEINLPVSNRLNPQGDRFPSGDGQSGGSFALTFLVTKNIGVDGDFTVSSTGVLGTLETPYTNIQQGLETAEFANLASEVDAAGDELPVQVRVAPAITPYLAFDPRLDPTPLTTNDRGNLVIPDNTHLVLDANFEIAKELWIASAAPDDPTTSTVNEANTLPGLIFRVDANSPNGGAARILGVFNAPVPTPGNVGMGYDGTNLYLVHDADGLDTDPDRIYVLDPLTGQQITSFAVPVSSAGGANIDGLAVSDSLIYVSDSATDTIFKLDKHPATSTAVAVGSLHMSFDMVGGIDYDAINDSLWVSGIASGVPQLFELNPHTGAILSTYASPGGATSISGVGLVDGQPLFSDPASNLIYRLNFSNPVASQSFTPPVPGVAALAGVSESHLALKFLGTRIEVAGTNSALIARGRSIDNPIVFTSTRDNSVLGSGVSSAAPADWMGIAFRPPSDDFASRLENVAVHFAGGPGTIIPGVTQTLSPITLFDARPSIINAEISNNAESAIAATPDSFERLLGRSGPDLFWDVDAGVPIPGDWDPTTPGTEFGVYQSNSGRVFVDLNGNRKLERTEDLNCSDSLDTGEDQNRNFTLDKNDRGCAFGAPGETPLVGDFSATAGDEIATFDRSTGLWNIDRNRDFTLNFPDDTVAVQFGQHGDIPIVGDWDGDGIDQVGVYRPRPKTSDSECLDAAALGLSCFILDLNNNLSIDADEQFLFGERTDKPVVGDFAPGTPGDEIGVYRPTSGDFLLDRNANHIIDLGERDLNGNQQEDPAEVIGTPNGVLDVNDGPIVFGAIGARPVIGDWCTDNPSTVTIECPGDEIGVVDGSLKWLVDSNGTLKQDATEIATQFGQAGDLPVPGEWATDAGEAGDEIGVFRPTIGQWFVDSDSDNKLDPSEDLDRDGHLDVNEDANGNSRLDVGEDKDEDGRLDVSEDIDPDGVGPLQKNGVLDLNDGGFVFTAALRNDINQFVARNSLNAVWVKPGFQTVSDAHWDDVQLPHVLTGPVDIQALPAIGVVPTLQIEPGMVVKMGQANLAVGGFGSTLLIDSDLEIDQPRIVFTSLLDDAHGPNGQRHDTNNDQGALAPLPGDWGGIVASQGASVIINGADIQYGGNLRIPFRGFIPGLFPQSGLISPNPITLNGGPIFATITNNIIANTNNVNNTTNPRTRPSDIAAIGVVDANSLGSGPNLARIPFNANPFIRGNDVDTNNGLNGLEIRTDGQQPAVPSTIPDTITVNTFISQDSVWDDTDITHILLGTVNWDSFGFQQCLFLTVFNIDVPCTITLGLRSNAAGTYDSFDGTINGPAESLVIKMGGRFSTPFTLMSPLPLPLGFVSVVGAGFQVGWDDGNANTPAQGFPDDTGADSRIIVQGVAGNADLGIPQTPVIFTSIRDDSIGAGGSQEDTNNDSTATAPAPGDWGGIVVGAWAESNGRISPLNGAPLSPSFVRDADIRFASTGVLAQSQPLEISNSIIRSSRDFGINAIQGPAIPNTPQGRNPNTLPRIPASVQVWNSELVSNATGIRNAGGGDANFPQEPQPPRSIIINNTLHQNGTAINLTTRAGPLIMNNSISSVGNTGSGILIDAATLNLPFENPPQHERPQLLRNLFFGLANNGFTGTVPRGLGGLEIVGVDPGYASPGAPDFNFHPSSNSPLVDSSMSEFGQPTVFDQFFDSLWGVVNAPERDKLGAFRRDHFGTANIGVGQRPWLDIGAVELIDVLSAFPRVVSMNPVPNTNFPNGFAPALVELEFSEAVTNVNTSTFIIEASGGDRSFNEGNEVRLTGQVSSVAGSGGTRWVFAPSSTSSFNNFQNEIFRVTAFGSGSTPISAVATDNALDGEFSGTFPSGDGVEGGDFRATFTVGDVITGNVFYVDDTSPPCAGVPRNDPNLRLFNSIQTALTAASAGDTILVCPGVYTVPLTMPVPVTLESIEGAMPKKDALNRIIAGTGTFISVQGGAAAITINNLSGQHNPRIGSTRGGVNHGFVITTSPISGPNSAVATGVGIDIVGTAVDIEGNVIISNTIGIRADSVGTSRLPNITNNLIVGNTASALSGGSGGAGIDIISRTRDALATIVNNTIAYNQAGVLLREDGLDPLGRIVATVQNNIITSNSLTGLSAASARANPNVFHNDAWGNANNTSNFGGTLPNLPPSAFSPGRDGVPGTADDEPVPDRVCTTQTTVCGNISVNPLFINPLDPRSVSDRAEFFRISNFELQQSSKLIDRGKDVGSPQRDFKGRTRTIDVPNVGNDTSAPPLPAPDSDPRSVDIGAYEFVPGGIASSIGERSMSATRSNSAKTDAVLDQLGFQVLGQLMSKKQLKQMIDAWLDDEWR